MSTTRLDRLLTSCLDRLQASLTPMAPCCSITDTFDISLRDLVDYYFVPLKACIDIADVGAFMCSCALISP